MGLKVALYALRYIPKGFMESGVNPWAEHHTDPLPPKETFREWYRKQEETDEKPNKQ